MGPNPHQKNGIVRKFWKKGGVSFCPIPKNQKEDFFLRNDTFSLTNVHSLFRNVYCQIHHTTN